MNINLQVLKPQSQDKATVILVNNNKPILPRVLKRMQHKLTSLSNVTIIDYQMICSAHKVKEWKCDALQAPSYNQLKLLQLLPMISNVKFSQLTRLGLSNCGISSIQALSRIMAPCLQKLILEQNQISCISALKKICSPNIKQLCFNDNYIQQGQSIAQFNTKQLTKLSIEASDDKYPFQLQYYQINCIKFCVKMQFNTEQIYLNLSPYHRISQKYFKQSLLEKAGNPNKIFANIQ